MLPNYVAAALQVPLRAGQSHRLQHLAAIATHQVDDAVVVDWDRDAVDSHAR